MGQTVVFDLEATCWEEKNNIPSEIIEIGAVKLDGDGNEIGTFQTFVRPVISPILSDFCTKLTSIQQDDVSDAPMFSEAMSAFESWIGDDADLVSWGLYDKTQIMREVNRNGYKGRISAVLEGRHLNLKQLFSEMRGAKPCGMEKALSVLNIPLEGIHHRGIDDAMNIAKIWKVYMDVVNQRPIAPGMKKRLGLSKREKQQ
ncbi:MAG: exonuclease domain-containing protein [Holophagales bacterium]|jgi:inhibitor of KinA sporulation pathway (predicted exonuclease)|nr:exonuclease domain-containing protein [Holophagales bacterium]